MRFDETLFGPLEKHQVWTDEETLNPGDTVYLVNTNCEFPYDNVTGNFEKHSHDLMYCFICDLKITETDLTGYEPEKSNNGGCYAFATAEVLEVYEKTY